MNFAPQSRAIATGLAIAISWIGATAALAEAPTGRASERASSRLSSTVATTPAAAAKQGEIDHGVDNTVDHGDNALDEIQAPARPKVVLEWSKSPAANEAALRRRLENPLYMESRRKIGKAELLAAKRLDSDRQWQELENFIDLISAKKRMEKYESASQMAEALLRIDEGTWNAIRVGGQAYALAKSLQKMRAKLLKQWRDSSAGDPGVKALLDAEGRLPTVNPDSPAVRFIALIQSNNSPIPAYEMGVALMSEDAAAISEIYQSLRGDLKDDMSKQLRLVLQDIGRDRVEFADKDKKVAIAAGLLNARPSDFGI